MKTLHKERNPEAYLLSECKRNAKRNNHWFDLDIHDIKIPDTCPVLGITLSWTGDSSNSPSIDRVDCTRGYERGNVIITSWRANRLKSDASIKEMQEVALFYTILADERKERTRE